MSDDLAADLVLYLRQQQQRGITWMIEEPVDLAPFVPAQMATSPPSPAPVAPAPPAAADEAKRAREEAFLRECAAFVAESLASVARTRQALAAAVADAAPVAPINDKAAALATLAAEVAPCANCALHAGRTQTVFGSGSADADLVLIGEAPGRDEDLQGQPFVGASGQLLTKILGAVDLARDEVYICNILKCRPPNNRDPLPDEVVACEPYLKRQLAILEPRLILCLGRIAAQTLLGTKASLASLRRTVHFYQGIPVMSTYHPAALLRDAKYKRDTWDDVRKARALLEALRKDLP
jgi:uracil-DNA glycosylase